jgi:hypothetical protein
MRSLTLALALTASVSAQALEDVIYKKDGSILRGQLIEQDFENGRYKIQLQGGSIFAVSKDDINKITKEAPLNSTVKDDTGVNINIENNPVITQSPTQSIQQTSTLQTYAYTGDQAVEKRHSIRVGHMGKDISNSDDYGVSFSGINIAYQYNLDEHVAFYSEYNKGDFDAIISNGEYVEASRNPFGILSFSGVEVSAMLSTNNYQGWQFYAGLGAFKESYTFQDYNDEAVGTVITLGMGYSWKTVQLHMRVSEHSSSDYDYGTHENLSSANFALQLAFNY